MGAGRLEAGSWEDSISRPDAAGVPLSRAAHASRTCVGRSVDETGLDTAEDEYHGVGTTPSLCPGVCRYLSGPEIRGSSRPRRWACRPLSARSGSTVPVKPSLALGPSLLQSPRGRTLSPNEPRDLSAAHGRLRCASRGSLRSSKSRTAGLQAPTSSHALAWVRSRRLPAVKLVRSRLCIESSASRGG